MSFLSLVFFFACQESSNEPQPIQEHCAHLDQGGIVGRVLFSSGDGMPGPGNEDGSAGIGSNGIQTTIALYAPIESGSVPEIYSEDNLEMYGVFDNVLTPLKLLASRRRLFGDEMYQVRSPL